MDLQCDLLDPRKNMHACMQNLEVAVLCTAVRRCVPVPAIINFLLCFGYFRSDYLFIVKMLYLLQPFCERHVYFEFYQVIRLIKPQNICNLITLDRTGKL